ncbi:MAG: hydantoinase/oxoprolinase family protein [Variibacter sp.]
MSTTTNANSLRPPWRIGVDVGGTFTDLVMVDSAGTLSVAKVPSTPRDPSEGVLAAIDKAAADLSLGARDLLSNCNRFVHASTVATNVILERKGEPVGMLVTRGFRDSIEIRRGIRKNAWDHRVAYPPVLSPRYLRLPVSGRIDRHGKETAPLNAEDVRHAIRHFKEEGVRSIAVCLYNSFLNGAHEAEVGEIIAAEYPDAWISLSSQISHVMGEYERSSTAVLNAYIAPRIVTYMKRLSRALKKGGLEAPLLVVQNNGGSLTIEKVEERPVSLLLSGPAAGVGALSLYAGAFDRSKMLSMEIGGTSCDVMLISEDGAEMASEFELGGYHVALPSIEIHSIGAGGGTIAGIDKGGMMFAGPHGAGAEPGPAAYGHGGELPTVTDAQLVLGRLRPGPLAGGRTLDLALAAQAIERHLAIPLKISVEAAAAGILRLVEQQLFHAVQKISAERGHDPRKFILVAAGGAGPMHGSAVGRKLGSPSVYVPRLAGTFCALGMLNAPIKHDFGRALFYPGGPSAVERMSSVIKALETEANRQLASDGFRADEISSIRELELRHPGQVGTLRVAMSDTATLAWPEIVHDFHAAHERMYGHRDEGASIEVAGVRVTGVGSLSPIRLRAEQAAAASVSSSGERSVYFESSGRCVTTRIYAGEDMRPGASISGPAIIEEKTTCIVVEPGDLCTVDTLGNYFITFDSKDSAR